MRSLQCCFAILGIALCAGCSNAIAPVETPQFAEFQFAQVDPAPPPDSPDAGSSTFYAAEQEILRSIPHGPADPVWRMPVIPQQSEHLASALSGPFRSRTWETKTATYPAARFEHMPRWLADPMDDSVQDPGPALAFFYSPARFLANVVALPATVLVHPLWTTETTNLTPLLVEDETGMRVVDAADR